MNSIKDPAEKELNGNVPSTETSGKSVENIKTTEGAVNITPVAVEEKKFRPSEKGNKGGRRPNRRASRRDTRIKPEFDQKIVSLRRVTRVMAGGRRFNFSAAIVAGNRKGMVGVGQGKAADTPLAIEKAFRNAKKNMINVNVTNNMSIPHEVEAKFAASFVKLMPAPGKGILAGSSVRTVLELAGLKDVGGKLLSRSKNGANNAYVTIKALKSLDGTRIKEK